MERPPDICFAVDHLFFTISTWQNTKPAKHHHSPAAAPVPEAWVKTELARHPQRPYPMDFIEALFTDFSEIHGDRAFGDDTAMSCGMARFHGEPVLVIGNLKGRTLKERVARKFGSPDPEGYRKALRCMKIAEKFGRPIFTFIDLAGANPGIGAEERGQGKPSPATSSKCPASASPPSPPSPAKAALAERSLSLSPTASSCSKTPSTRSSPPRAAPPSCGRTQQEAASGRRSQVHRNRRPLLGCVDDVIPEPDGGTQNDPAAAMSIVGEKLHYHLGQLRSLPLDDLLEQRYQKFRNIAQFYTTA